MATRIESLHEMLDNAPLSREHWKIWFLCAMGIFIDGFDLFVIAVAMPLIVQDLQTDKWVIGLIGAAAPLGAMLGAGTLGFLTDRIGRKAMYMIDLIIFILFSALCLASWNAWWLIAFRFLLGVGVGADYPISSSYIAEFMPSRVRGKMLAGAFSFQAVGSLAGALCGLFILQLAPDVHAWRLMLGAGVIPAMIVLFMRHSAPESPRWLMRNGRISEARKVVALVCPAASQENTIRIEPVPEPGAALETDPVAPPRTPVSVLFSKTYLRRTILALVPWFLLDVALYAVGTFTPTVIAKIVSDEKVHKTLTASFIHKDVVATEGAIFLDLFLIAGFLLAIFLVERVGRIRLQMLGFVGMSLGLVILAFASHHPTATTGGATANATAIETFLVFAGFAIFNLLVNMGPNSTTYLLAAELFPTDLRATAHGIASAAGKVGAVIGIFFLPIAMSTFGLPQTMFAVASTGVLGFIVTYCFGVETTGRSLESVESLD